jgi:hypothetical protein
MLTLGRKLLDFIEKAATDRKKSRGRRLVSLLARRPWMLAPSSPFAKREACFAHHYSDHQRAPTDARLRAAGGQR